MSFREFQKYIDEYHGHLSIDFYRDLFPQIKVSLYLGSEGVFRNLSKIPTEPSMGS